MTMHARATPKEMVASFWRNRSLFYVLVKRDILARYQGTILGIFWSFLQPLLMILIYTFVFSVIFKARWQSGGGSKIEFALVLFAGLIIFNVFADCINRSTQMIVSNANYVKKVVFPLEILPWVCLGSAIFQSMMSFGVWLLFYILFFGMPHASVLLLPLLMLPIIFTTIGCSWFIASLGVYLRDIGPIIAVLITMLMFVSPIFYPLAAIPKEYQYLIELNPLTPVIEAVRGVLYWGWLPNPLHYTCYVMVSLLVAYLGFVWFQKTRKGFADVL